MGQDSIYSETIGHRPLNAGFDFMWATWLDSEAEILRRVSGNTQLLANAIHFALSSVFQFADAPFSQNVSIAINVPRGLLGLPADRKPGDIDLLVVPHSASEMLFEKSIAIEAKIVRPTQLNPGK